MDCRFAGWVRVVTGSLAIVLYGALLGYLYRLPEVQFFAGREPSPFLSSNAGCSPTGVSLSQEAVKRAIQQHKKVIFNQR